jgi:hypothetical protein
MKISPLPDQATAIEALSSQNKPIQNAKALVLPSNTAAAVRAATPGNKTSGAGAAGSSQSAAPTERPTDISLRRDNNGRIYYVVSDAQSGQEIIQVPPKALRNISQGIEDYLKEAQSNAAAHLEIKA